MKAGTAADGLRQERTARGVLAVVSLCLALIGFIACGPVLLTVMDGTAYLALLVLAALVSVLLVRAAHSPSRLDYMAPIHLFTLWFVLDYAAGPVWAMFNLYSPTVSLEAAFRDRAMVNRSLIYVDVAYLCVLLGYYSRIGPMLSRRLPQLHAVWPASTLLPKVLVAYAFGMAIKLYGYSQGVNAQGFSVGSPAEFWAYDYIQNFSRFTLYAMAIMFLTGVWKESAVSRTAFGVMVLAEFGSAVMATSKSAVMLVLFVLLMASNYRHRLLRARHFLLLFVLALLVVFPLMDMYKGQHYQVLGYHLEPGEQSGFMGEDLGQQLSFRSAAEAVRRELIELSEMSIGDYFQKTIDVMGGRQNQVNHLANIIANTPDPFPYRMGADLPWILPDATIPRLIWPGKVEPQDGNIYDEDYIGQAVGAGAGPNFMADLYMNFGWVGIPIGMFLVGFMMRFVYEYLIVNQQAASPGVFYYLFLVIPLLDTYVETSIAGLATSIKLTLYLTTLHLFMLL